MNKEELLKKTKEELVKMLIEFMKVNEKLLDENNALFNENTKARIEPYIYNEFLRYKEMYESERQSNIHNTRSLQELSDLLDRYKHIVDKLGGRYE
ncbi:MAG: hypothetical protein J6Q96_01095 [Bacteroidales bacterium]|nr:hypothetical protein [Bacteroidales bacterium]